MTRHPDFQTAFEKQRSGEPPPATSGLSSQLESRFLSSKALAAEINSVISSLRAVIAPPALKAEHEADEHEEQEATSERPSKVAKLALASNPTTVKSKVSYASGDDSSSEEDGSDTDGNDEAQVDGVEEEARDARRLAP